MAKKTALERAAERINELQAAREKELEQHAARIKGSNIRVANARRLMEQAEAAGDLDAYKSAKLELIDAETEIEFSTSRTGRLQDSALVDAAEGKRMVQEILDEEQTAQKADEAAIMECVAQLRIIGTRNKRRREKLVSVLHTWHADICKDEDKPLENNSKVFAFVEHCINDNQYRQIAGEPIGTAFRGL